MRKNPDEILDPRIVGLYDDYTHGRLKRREFLKKLVNLAGGAAAAVALLPFLENTYAKSQIVAEDDSRLHTEYVKYPGEAGDVIDLSLDERVRASLKVVDGITTGGRIHFGGAPFGVVTYDAIRMTGELSFLDYEHWMTTMDQLGGLTDVSLEDEISRHVESLTLKIDRLMLFALELDHVDALIVREPAQWRAFLENDMLAGEVLVPDAEPAPLDVHLQRLSFESGEDDEDPLGGVDPTTIADVDFTLDQLRKAVARRDAAGLKGKVDLEASGGVSLDDARHVAETGVDRIAVGALTHSATALDISMEM